MNAFDFYYGCLVGLLLWLIPSLLYLAFMLIVISRAGCSDD